MNRGEHCQFCWWHSVMHLAGRWHITEECGQRGGLKRMETQFPYNFYHINVPSKVFLNLFWICSFQKNNLWWSCHDKPLPVKWWQRSFFVSKLCVTMASDGEYKWLFQHTLLRLGQPLSPSGNPPWKMPCSYCRGVCTHEMAAKWLQEISSGKLYHRVKKGVSYLWYAAVVSLGLVSPGA